MSRSSIPLSFVHLNVIIPVTLRQQLHTFGVPGKYIPDTSPRVYGGFTESRINLKIKIVLGIFHTESLVKNHIPDTSPRGCGGLAESPADSEKIQRHRSHLLHRVPAKVKSYAGFLAPLGVLPT